jgi:ribosomal protein S12 methylthiotransferase accessory factor
MEKRIKISFPGKKRVDATIGEFTVQTDQLTRNGGDGSAPQPFDLFFVALATCAGISALDYAQERSLPTDGLDVTLVATRHVSEPRYDRVCINVTMPDGFPEEHVAALLEDVSNCSVKRHVLQPPSFEVVRV